MRVPEAICISKWSVPQSKITQRRDGDFHLQARAGGRLPSIGDRI